ncbi:MAG: hypothetical protein DBY27_10060 [Clostridiaceae bacterium]|nr:MAG: hypothetical protein DBY27_10060 [Clostridiaceae bacterium]
MYSAYKNFYAKRIAYLFLLKQEQLYTNLNKGKKHYSQKSTRKRRNFPTFSCAIFLFSILSFVESVY